MLNEREKQRFGLTPNAKNVVDVAFPKERSKRRRRLKGFLFPKMHEDVSKSWGIFLAHGSTFDLEESLVVELEVIAAKSDFEERENVGVGSVARRVKRESSFDRIDALLNRNISVEGFNIESEKNVSVENGNVMKKAFEMEAVANERRDGRSDRLKVVVNEVFHSCRLTITAGNDGSPGRDKVGNGPLVHGLMDFGQSVEVTRSGVRRRKEKTVSTRSDEALIAHVVHRTFDDSEG